jgi:crotonobetainyl-CoA:carnitine CoA-transferase CaiB-like acyl-CoA transferase
MYAYSNILAALLLREKTGLGSCIDISMLECLSEWMSFPLYYAMDEATPPPRNAASHATIYPYGPFLAGDGKTVMLGLQNEREWLQFCRQVLLNEALAIDPRFNSNTQRNENRAALEQIILETFRPLNSQQVITRLDQAQIANAKLNDMAGLWQHQQLAARQRWANVESESGTMPALIPPGINNAYDYRMGPIPRVGEHTTTILQELGLSQHEISTLRQAGTI